MKTQIMLVIVTALFTQNAIAEGSVKPKNRCQSVALKSALEELKAEFPDSGSRKDSTIDSIRQQRNRVIITIDNQFANDLPLDIIVPVKTNADRSNCSVTGTPEIQSEDNS